MLLDENNRLKVIAGIISMSFFTITLNNEDRSFGEIFSKRSFSNLEINYNLL